MVGEATRDGTTAVGARTTAVRFAVGERKIRFNPKCR